MAVDFDVWSNKKKAQQEFARWAQDKKRAKPEAASYSAPFYGAGDAARTGVECTQTQPEKQAPTTRQVAVRQTQPVFSNYSAPFYGVGDSVRLGVEPTQPEKQQGAKPQPAQPQKTRSQTAAPPVKKPGPSVRKPYTPTGQAARLGIEAEPPKKPFAFSRSPKAEIPANRFSAREAVRLPGFQARTGMAPIPSSADISPENLLAATPLGA